jgi:hypothetical protein
MKALGSGIVTSLAGEEFDNEIVVQALIYRASCYEYKSYHPTMTLIACSSGRSCKSVEWKSME